VPPGQIVSACILPDPSRSVGKPHARRKSAGAVEALEAMEAMPLDEAAHDRGPKRKEFTVAEGVACAAADSVARTDMRLVPAQPVLAPVGHFPRLHYSRPG